MMETDCILEKDLPDILILLKKLSISSPKDKRKWSESILSRSNDTFEALDIYLKKLPDTVNSLSCADRIVLLNCRHFLSNLSVLMDYGIKSVFYECKQEVRKREKALKPEEPANGVKPLPKRKRKIGKVEKALSILKDRVITIREDSPPAARGIAIGRDVIWTAGSFDVDMPPLSDIRAYDAIRHLEGQDRALPAELTRTRRGDLTELPIGLFQPENIDFSHPSHASKSLENGSGELLRDEDRLSKSIVRIIPEMSVLLPADEDIGPSLPSNELSEGYVRESRSLLIPDQDQEAGHLNLFKNLEALIVDGYPDLPIQRNGEKKNQLFVEKPLLSRDQYKKLLSTKSKDPVKFYTQVGDALDFYFHVPNEEELMEAELRERSCDGLIVEPIGTVPEFETPLYLSDIPVPSPQDNIHSITIQEFELPPVKRPFTRESNLDILRGEQVRDRATPMQTRQTLGEHTVEDISSSFRLGLDLDAANLNLPFEHQEHSNIIGDEMPQRHERSVSELGTEQPALHPALDKNYEEKLWESLVHLCTENENFTIRFIELCNISETRFVAARVFSSLLDSFQL